MLVSLDVRPRSDANKVNPKSTKNINVAICSVTGFDAITADQNTVRNARHRVAEPQPKQPHFTRDTEFTEIGVFVYQELFALRRRCLHGHISEFFVDFLIFVMTSSLSSNPLF
jgi:hypothetical protein